MIELNRAKQHLRVDHDDDDGYIISLIDASTAAARDYLNDPDGVLSEPVEIAILLQVGDLYSNRERQSEKPYFANSTYERLISPYRIMEI